MARYLFIDGAYFHRAYENAMRQFFGEVPSINYEDLAQSLGGGERIYYYDAIDRQSVLNETDAERDERIAKTEGLHKYLNTLPNWHVREGFVSRGRRSRRRQKAVDVQLAVDALEHAVARNMNVASFVLGDLDFEPLFFSLNRFGVAVHVRYEYGTATDELLEAADVRELLTVRDFYNLAIGSFKNDPRHPAPDFQKRLGRPKGDVKRNGKWNGRRVFLVERQSKWFLYVEPGVESREQSIQVHWPTGDVQKTEQAFTMTYGGNIDWE